MPAQYHLALPMLPNSIGFDIYTRHTAYGCVALLRFAFERKIWHSIFFCSKANSKIISQSAYVELKEAWHFDYVIPNHDGEDSENWDAFYYPVGDAHKTLLAFADLVGDKVSAVVEKWEEGLLS